MSMRQVVCPSRVTLSRSEHAMLEAVPERMDVVDPVLWCELEHPTGREGQDDTVHLALGQAGTDLWWVRWSNDGNRRELVCLPPCQAPNGAPAGQDDTCSLAVKHEGRHSWEFDPERF